ncbi:MAG: hypothetical protein WCR14_05485, partial [Bacteroidaceae bacterium]
LYKERGKCGSIMSRTNDLYALGKHTMCPSQIDKMSKQGGYRYLVFISIRLFCFMLYKSR